MTGSLSPLGVVLAGGASRRFGAPKALAAVGGRRIVDRVRGVLAEVTDVVVVSGALPLDGAGSMPDTRAGLGPLGGVLTALRRAGAEGRPGVLVAGCDMPFLDPALFRLLGTRGAESGAAAVVPASGGRRGFEPLCAWYSVRAIAALEGMADAGVLGLHRLAERAEVEVIPLGEVRAIGDPERLFFNDNTMDDLREAEMLERRVLPAHDDGG